MSVYQYANSRPLEIKLPLLRTLRTVQLLQIPTNLLMITLLVCTNTISPFISTFLLSDMNVGTVLGNIIKTPLRYRSSNGYDIADVNMFFSRPSGYPLFAENNTQAATLPVTNLSAALVIRASPFEPTFHCFNPNEYYLRYTMVLLS